MVPSKFKKNHLTPKCGNLSNKDKTYFSYLPLLNVKQIEIIRKTKKYIR